MKKMRSLVQVFEDQGMETIYTETISMEMLYGTFIWKSSMEILINSSLFRVVL